jgi:hypothetical protein
VADTWRDATNPLLVKPTSSGGPLITGDLRPLTSLLCSKVGDDGTLTLTREESELLIDLLSRHCLKGLAGGRQTPIYKGATEAELKLLYAAEWVRYWESQGRSHDDAVNLGAREIIGVSAEALRLFMRGRHSANERRGLLPPPKRKPPPTD